MAKKQHGLSTFDPKIAKEICDRIASDESLTSICREDRMPHIGTVYGWINKSAKDPEKYDYFHVEYVRARILQADTQFDVISDTCDDVRNGLLEPHAARVILDAKRWQMSKIRPDRYGDKIQVEQDTAITVEIVNFTDIKKIKAQSEDDDLDIIGYPVE